MRWINRLVRSCNVNAHCSHSQAGLYGANVGLVPRRVALACNSRADCFCMTSVCFDMHLGSLNESDLDTHVDPRSESCAPLSLFPFVSIRSSPRKCWSCKWRPCRQWEKTLLLGNLNLLVHVMVWHMQTIYCGSYGLMNNFRRVTSWALLQASEETCIPYRPEIMIRK